MAVGETCSESGPNASYIWNTSQNNFISPYKRLNPRISFHFLESRVATLDAYWYSYMKLITVYKFDPGAEGTH